MKPPSRFYLKAQGRLCGAVSFVVLSGLLATGCNNNFGNSAQTQANTTSIPAADTSGGDQTNAFTITQVLPDSINPNGVVMVIGDGTGSLGNFCVPTIGSSQGGSAVSPTVCQCDFKYSSASQGPNLDLQTPLTYHESNLVRCATTQVPSDVTTMQVSILLTTTSTYSNILTFNFTNGANTVDTTNAINFWQVIRYQCRDVVFIPHLLDSNIYDPLQSDNPHLTYPLDYYATNLGGTIATYASKSTSNYNWNCPSVLNPVSSLTSSAYTTYIATNNINLTLYSKGPLSNGSKVIYPTNINPGTGYVDRATFYLSKTSTGIFNVPVNAYQSPGVITANGDLVAPSLGYGASPLATAPGQEKCPSSTTGVIPPGYQWVKIWLFRAGLQGRQSYAIANPPSIACSPGDWIDNTGANKGGVFGSCPAKTANPLSFGLATTPITNNSHLANRIYGIGSVLLCARLDLGTGGASGPAGFCAASVHGAGPSCITTLPLPSATSPNSDMWLPWFNDSLAPSDQGLACTSGVPNTVNDFFNIFSSNPGSCTAGSDATMLSSAPVVINPTVKQVDANSSRFDYVFVVSPPSITTLNMQDTSSTSPALPYQPYRFYLGSDCSSNDPDNPSTPGDCNPTNAITNYQLMIHDVGDTSNPTASDPNSPIAFPVCALQPIQPTN